MQKCVCVSEKFLGEHLPKTRVILSKDWTWDIKDITPKLFNYTLTFEAVLMRE